jgi:hypothetical protein
VAVLLPYPARARLAAARKHVERGLRTMLHGSTPSRQRRPNALPWFDRPGALAEADRRARDAAEAACFRHWVEHGYFVLRDVVDPADIDRMIAGVDALWTAPTPTPNLTLLDLRDDVDQPARSLTHAELLALPLERRQRMRAVSNWRIHGLHYLDPFARRMFRNARLRCVMTRLFGRRAKPFAAINFMAGSQQHLHQDMAVFHIYPHDYLVGAWIACEDIRPESGPLVFHPGSHTSGMFPGFTNYPQTNLRTADETTTRAYEAWVDDIAQRTPRHEFLARKGEILVWHGMLLHGGAPVRTPGMSRKSFVIHYTAPGADRGREVEGPFNW